MPGLIFGTTTLAAQRMNILYLSSSPQIGGGNRSLLLLARACADEGHRVRLIVPDFGPMIAACQDLGLESAAVGIQQPSWSHPTRSWRSYQNVTELLSGFGADLVHANDLMTARSFMTPAWRRRTPVVCHVRYPASREFVGWVFRLLPKPGAFILNSNSLRSEIGPLLKRACPRAAQTVIYNAVSLEEFTPQRKKSESPRVGIIANLIPVKGHLDFLGMGQLLCEWGYSGEFWIIGGDIHGTGLEAELRQAASRMGLGSKVKFFGHREDVAPLINDLDIVVCSSHVEPFGRCLIEAMACEKPIVATNVGGIPEVVEDQVTGYLVPPHAPDQMAEKVLELAQDQGLRQRMGMEGRRRVQRLFSWERNFGQTMAVYESLTSD